MDASNLLKPALAGGNLRCIGSTTYKEYRQHFEKDRALVRRFQKIDVNEPSIEDAVKILKGLKPYFEEFHKVRYTDDAIETAVQLSARYMNDRKLPDKAIDVIDETGASLMLLPENKRKTVIGVPEIEETVATMARIPAKTVSKDDATVLRDLDKELKRMVFGQDKAIGALASAIKLARAGLREPEKPIGCYLFSGPDGRRQDRGRQAPRRSAGRQASALRHVGIHGAPFGVAADRRASGLCRLRPGRPSHRWRRSASLLRAAARRDREGASRSLQHPSAGDGSRQAHRPQWQVGRVPQHHPDHDHQCRRAGSGQGRFRLHAHAREGDDQEAINRMFSPEFRNRLDATIGFDHLPPEIVRKVVEKFVLQLEAQLSERQVNIELSDEAANWLAEKGYDQQMGARPLARVIQEYVKKPLADEVLFGKLAKGGTVRVLLEKTEDGEGQLHFQYLSRDEEKALPKPPERKALTQRKTGRPSHARHRRRKRN